MKNLINKAMNLFTEATVRVHVAVGNVKEAACCRTRAALAGNRAEGFVDTAVKILIAIVIGALVLAGLYLLFSGTILPTLTQRIQEMFNYKG